MYVSINRSFSYSDFMLLKSDSKHKLVLPITFSMVYTGRNIHFATKFIYGNKVLWLESFAFYFREKQDLLNMFINMDK